MGGLAAIFASNAQRSVGDINIRLGDNNKDLSVLQDRIGNLTDAEHAILGNLTIVQTTTNNAATDAQLRTVTMAAKRAKTNIEDICKNVSCMNCTQSWRAQ